MKNDITWKHTNNSELNIQSVASSLGNLVGLRSKTPVPRSPLPVPHSHRYPLPDTGTISALLERKNYLAETLEKDSALSPAKRKHLCAELDALTRALSFTRLILEKLPPDQFCKIITKYDEINGIPPSSPESILHRIDHAREAVRMKNEQ